VQVVTSGANLPANPSLRRVELSRRVHAAARLPGALPAPPAAGRAVRDLDVDALLRPVRDDRAELYVRAAAAELSRWRIRFIRDAM